MRWVLGVLGTAAVLGSLFGLTLPLSLHVVDRSGSPIACGTAFHPDQRRAPVKTTLIKSCTTVLAHRTNPATTGLSAMRSSPRDAAWRHM